MGKDIQERHRHRYEVNGQLIDAIEQAGLKVSGAPLMGNRLK